MKHIVKGNGPQSLHDWVQGQQSVGLSPAFRDLQNPQKAECRTELLLEQGSLCCYCNRRLSVSHMHIEHLEPQSSRPDLEVDWGNLLACCEPQNLKGRKLRTQCHCGEHRGNLPVGISPLEPNCESNFHYSLQGNIKAQPNSNLNAKIAIENLNLEAERLRSNRQALITQAYDDIEVLTESEWLAVYVETQEGTLPEFSAMLHYFFKSAWRDEKRALEAEATDREEAS